MAEVAQLQQVGTLADRINAEHHACVAATVSALEHATAAGALLLQAKAEQGHGAWLPWLEANFAGSVRTAQVYMRLARDPLKLQVAKAQGAAHLSISGALQALVEPPKRLKPTPHYAPPVHDPTPADEEAEERITDAEHVLRTVASLLGGAVAPELALRPEEAAEALRRMPRKDRAARIARLREGAAWLQQVLEAADQAPGQ
jgi:hypothetical protein